MSEFELPVTRYAMAGDVSVAYQDHGGDRGGEELHHHLSRPIHDHGAGSGGAAAAGFGVEVMPMAQCFVPAEKSLR